MVRQPDWCCSDCGRTYGKRLPECATYHDAVCGVCGVWRSVTEPRDYGYLRREWRGHGRTNGIDRDADR